MDSFLVTICILFDVLLFKTQTPMVAESWLVLDVCYTSIKNLYHISKESNVFMSFNHSTFLITALILDFPLLFLWKLSIGPIYGVELMVWLRFMYSDAIYHKL